MKIFTVVAAALVAVAMSCSAFAQSTPNLSYGQVPTAGQWNGYFAAKQDYLGFTPIGTAGGTMTGRLVTAAPSTNTAGLNLSPGNTPAAPVNGDIWTTSAGFFARINGATIGPFAAATSAVLTAGVTPVGSSNTNGLLYALSGTLTSLATANNGVLITSGSGAPSISSTLPSALSIPNPTFTGTVAGAGTIPNAVLINSAVTINTVPVSLGGSVTVTAAAGTLTGTSLAANVVGSSLTSVGTLTGGATGAGFTVALSTSTVTGVLTSANGGSGVNNGSFTETRGGNWSSTSTVSITGAFSTAGAFTQVGAFATTITSTATSNATLPAGTQTLAALGLAQTFTAAQSFGSGNLRANGATSGSLTLNCAAICGSNTLTFPAGTTDFSATGGTSQVVKQVSAGGALTVGQLAASDLSNGVTGSGAAVLAVSPALTGVPTVPTAAFNTNTTQVASTQYVIAQISGSTSGVPTINGNDGAIIGVDTSTQSAQTGNYPIVSGDCGKLILASGGQNTITLPVSTGFPAACTITVKNTESYPGGRAKILSGFPSGIRTRLWPDESVTVKLGSGGAFVSTTNQDRWRNPTSVTLCTDVGGNDANDGLAGSGTGCLATAVAAANIVYKEFDTSVATPIIAVACSQTQTAQFALGSQPTGSNLIQLSPNGNCGASWSNAGPCISFGDNAMLDVNMTAYGSSGTFDFACNTTNNPETGHIYLHNYAVLDMEGTPTFVFAGVNDNFIYFDGPGISTIANGMSQRGGSAGKFIIRATAGAKITQSGTISAQASGGASGIYFIGGRSMLVLGTPNGGGWSSLSASIITGNSVLINNGITPAGSVTVGASSVNCAGIGSTC